MSLDHPPMIREWAKLLRLKHWIKNLLVLFPLFFSGEALASHSFVSGCEGFLTFALASSFVYILNDAQDVKEDSAHPRKKSRPLASGTISIRAAIIAASFLFAIALSSCIFLAERPSYSLGVLLIYIVLNVAYSFGLKAKPVIDVTILALGFLLRVMFGGFFCNIPISSWLFLTVLAISFFLALGKRWGEMTTYGSTTRKSLTRYTHSFLEKNMYMFLGLGLSFYSLWTFQRIGNFDATINLSTVAYISGILFAILLCLRYTYDLECEGTDGDPTEVLLGDITLIALVLCWFITMVVSVYVEVPL